jgi:hypothetical protein
VQTKSGGIASVVKVKYISGSLETDIFSREEELDV